ncbi:MAG: hypothetical protein Q8N06_14610 [Hydrogenophaga sp.]|nr:hypothetical protein [Hydrogenophaga sp.]MDP3311034.1 hypothetical protein [Polaromonas sp.]MDP3413907.1 hypothetical protein [Polaromonas sp.]MDP3604950.1 hypothetical protein [Polaromonas sp.]
MTANLLRGIRWAAIAGFCIAYAVLSHFAAADPNPDLFDAAVAMAAPLALGAVLAWRSVHRLWMLLLCLVVCATLYASRHWLVQHFNWVFLLQHAGMQGLLGLAFGRSLRAGEVPMVSRFAAVVHGSLSPALERYTRQVTWAWTLYFSLMTSLSLLLFWLAPVAVWSVFANLLNLPLLVMMFAAEYGARVVLLPASDRSGPLEAIRAWRQTSSGAAPPPT